VAVIKKSIIINIKVLKKTAQANAIHVLNKKANQKNANKKAAKNISQRKMKKTMTKSSATLATIKIRCIQ
jgi:hypothetical protein